MKHKLEGLTAALFLDGGWTLTGIVESTSDENLVVRSDGQLYLIFKSKVSAMSILEKGASAPIQHLGPEEGEPAKAADTSFPENRLHYDESAMSIPKSMLNHIDDGEDNNFSAFFGGEPDAKGGLSGMNFVIEGDDDPKE